MVNTKRSKSFGSREHPITDRCLWSLRERHTKGAVSCYQKSVLHQLYGLGEEKAPIGYDALQHIG